MKFTLVAIQKLKLGSIIVALAIFFLPWISIQCSGKKLITQTGIESVYGGVTPTQEMMSLAQSSNSDYSVKDFKAKNDFKINEKLLSPLAGLALLCIVAALIFACIALTKVSTTADMLSSALPAIALVLLLIQMIIKFPLETSFTKEVLEKRSTSSTSSDNPFEEMGEAFAKNMFQFKMEPAFYFEISALVLPTLFLFFGPSSRNRKNSQHSDFAHYNAPAHPDYDDAFQRNAPPYQEPQYTPPPSYGTPMPESVNPQPTPQPTPQPYAPAANSSKPMKPCAPLTYTSPYKFECPHCKQRYALKIIEKKTNSMTCKHCGHQFLVGAEFFNVRG